MTSATQKRRVFRLTLIGVIVVLALALGLGLGLGLKHHHHDGDASASAASSGPAAQLQAQPASNFVLDSIADQPPQTREFNFTLTQVEGAPDGFSRPMLTVNGIYPGPAIQANQADRLVIHVQNNLPNASSIHWHGLFQNGTNFYDGSSGITECGIPPGKSLTYNFTFGEFSGTTWWQYRTFVSLVTYLLLACIHTTSLISPADYSAQYTDGISGPLIVHPTAPTPRNLSQWDEELVVQMSDWYHDVSGVLLAQYFDPLGIDGTPGNEPVPDSGTLNGLGQYGSGGSYYNFTLQRNKRYRIRLANTGSFASIRFSVDSHPLTVIEADGTLLEPRDVAGVTLAVAQRVSVLLNANATAGSYWMRATVQSDMFTYDVPGQNTDIRGIIKYADAPGDALPGATDSDDPGPGSNLPDVGADGTLFVALVPDPAPAATVGYPVRFDFQNTDQNRFLGFMNSSSWEPLQGQATLLAVRENPTGFAPEGVHIAQGDQLLVTVDTIQVLDIRIDNLDDGDHPFHLHGHRPWIMGGGSGRYIGQPLNNTNPLRRDTVLIPAYSWVVLRFVTDNPGVWALHCHLAWHMAAGLLMQFSTLPSRAAQLPIPQDIVDQCAGK